MLGRTAAAALLLATLLASAFATSTMYVELEHATGFHVEGWVKESVAPDSAVMEFIVGPKLRNLEQLDEIFWAVSTPGEPRYGDYLTKEELRSIISPEPATVQRIRSWIEGAGARIDAISSGGDWLHCSATVGDLKHMLNVPVFNVYHNPASNRKLIRASHYMVPAAIAPLLDIIAGISSLPHLPASRPIFATGNAAPQTDALVDPAVLRARYNVTDFGNPSVNNSMAVAEFQAQYFSPSDLTAFFKEFVKGKPAESVAQVVGTNNAGSPGTEAELDVQYIMGMAQGTPTWVWSSSDFDFWTDLVSWTSWIGNNTTPWVHSVSYGDQREDQPSEDYKQRLNTEFQKLATLGHSIIFASGDFGTGCELCLRFQASFPSTSPYVTAVGATHFLNGGTSGPEGAVTAFPSGGGFSKSFSAPSYQTAAIAHYFKVATDLPDKLRYNAGGRGTPDVSALGIGFQVIQSGGLESVGGTSASTPTFSSMIALLNQVRIEAGKPVMGFLNPWIYNVSATNPNAFFDVTEGSNPDGCCLKGFSCAPGWDPVTGVGTPNYTVLKTLI